MQRFSRRWKRRTFRQVRKRRKEIEDEILVPKIEDEVVIPIMSDIDHWVRYSVEPERKRRKQIHRRRLSDSK